MRIVRTLALTVAMAAVSACTPAPPLKEYAYPAWGFAVSFRAPPTVTDTPAAADGSTAHTLTVEANVGGRDNLVNVIDGSSSTKSEEQALSDAPATLASSVGGTLGPITYAATGQIFGREFLLNRQGRPPARVQIFVSKKHLYELIAASDRGPTDPETSNFLASFRLLAP
jgi:hypothetical protein